MSRIILITGVSRGLGRAMVEGFIQEGHTVWGCARSKEAIDELSQKYGTPHRFDCVSVADATSVENWANTVLQSGTPDLVVNNAAMINVNNLLWNVPVEEFSDLVDANVKGTFHVIRSFVPAMIESGTGVIVNFSSTWGRSTSPEVAPYCATKFAIEGLTNALAQELPSGLATVALNPGIINTEMLQSCFGGGASNYPSANEWAQRAVPYLLSFSSRNNGESVTVPG